VPMRLSERGDPLPDHPFRKVAWARLL